MAIKDKEKFGVYLNPDNVDFLRKEYGDIFIMGSGLSGILDACLGQLVSTIKFFGKKKDGKSRVKGMKLKEFFNIQEV